MSKIYRIYVEKKKGFDLEAQAIFADLKEHLALAKLVEVRILNRYDISGVSAGEYAKARSSIFSEPPVDQVYEERFDPEQGATIFGIEYLPGQYDQRADSAAQCIQIISQKNKPVVAATKIVVLKGKLSNSDVARIKQYMINPVDSREASLAKPDNLTVKYPVPKDVEAISGFINLAQRNLDQLRISLGLAMSSADLLFCQGYFKNEEKRDPTVTEIKMLDTYWSDHCRHTTFNTLLTEIHINESFYKEPIEKTLKKFKDSVLFVYGEAKPDITLMKIATMSMKELYKKGGLADMEVSGENNACSIIRKVVNNNSDEEWLIMFKNETHNHPTEIEPFGGAATCLGGAIRDPLSGRSYVYHAMRVTGSGDPRSALKDTLAGKLPQRKITTEAALGYSSYGNQIGLATGLVSEVYHNGYIAKRMEVGAVIGAVKKENVIRREPRAGDVIFMVGGKTGRDGIGGATGSSKKHTRESITTAGTEVQKGNAPEERKLQRLFHNPRVTKIIKKSNDFGAGGVSVAIGELAEGLQIYLDQVPLKYEGLDGTELALSESQERMAVVVDKGDSELLKKLADEENLLAVKIADVTDKNRLKMFWRGSAIIDISRDFINTNGAPQKNEARITAPDKENNFFTGITAEVTAKMDAPDQAWFENLKQLNVCDQSGLMEWFDASIGGGTVFMPYGGKNQSTPIEAMVAKIPVSSRNTSSATVMGFGFNPYLSEWSPFHGAVYSVVEAVVKVVCAGGDYTSIRTSLQEYFEKLGCDPVKWGKPLAALLGAYLAHSELNIAAIGGKDSMSGSFMDLNVPPTLITFAVDVIDLKNAISPEFKKSESQIVIVKLKRDKFDLPDFARLRKNLNRITDLIRSGKILSAQPVKVGGVAAAITKMSFGNGIGFCFTAETNLRELFYPDYGSVLLEVSAGEDLTKYFETVDYSLLGKTTSESHIDFNGLEIKITAAFDHWTRPLQSVFTSGKNPREDDIPNILFEKRSKIKPAKKVARPRVLITAFPGSNCEYDTAAAFEKAGGLPDTLVFKNLHSNHIVDSITALKERIQQAQIIVIPGGFSAGDEPDGSGKFISAVFRNPELSDAVMDFLYNRDGIMLGICNGFQALVKLGLLPFGEIREMDANSPTLTYNSAGHHMSRMVTTKVVSVLSPWFANEQAGSIQVVPVSHGEGRFTAKSGLIKELFQKGQVASQYIDLNGTPAADLLFNPNGSVCAIEGITSPDGRILGKMAHNERIFRDTFKNIPGIRKQNLFTSGVDYYS